MYPEAGKMKTLAWQLSLAGFFPFGFLALLLLIVGSSNSLHPVLFDIFKIYSAIILSFLGGIRWGLAISYEPGERLNLAFSVIPSILAWFAVLLPNTYAVLILLVLFCAQGAWDNFYANSGKVQPWFGSLRVVLTLLVALAHILVFVSITGAPEPSQLTDLINQLAQKFSQ